ncbi:hypothetical protein RFI_30850 [Reticulomyxa filosa]|uniref:Uncharacterized protein n=1 Tax=Reticulomyxa filosa TaxID=46433 RepID=X6LX73_RETFI|nr:hypothetical protein RFI_30850 [Reticulomyxa filosa]|eukprot:ETO06543.1 hypothetical protein RFI_30850 [Reticulomyxa filosa]
MISFMAGILYDYIQNKKDLTGSGLLYFWKLLRSPSLAQLSPTRQMMLHMRYLDACKADTESPFLPSSLKDCHITLIRSFKSFLITWVEGSKLKKITLVTMDIRSSIDHSTNSKAIKQDKGKSIHVSISGVGTLEHLVTNIENCYPMLPGRFSTIFLLFKICVRLKREGRHCMELPKNTTFEQAYEKGIKELQVQLTTYWDYITAMKVHFVCPTLLGNWSWNVVDRLVNLKPNNKCCEMSLVVGHKDHSIYLSLCKTSTHILIRIDNRWMETIPSDTHPSKIVSTNDKNCTLIQPYLVAYFLCNSTNVDQHKEGCKIISNVHFDGESVKVIKVWHIYIVLIVNHRAIFFLVRGICYQLQRIGRIFLFKLTQITAICEITMLDIEFVWVMTFIIGFIIKKVRVLCSIEVFQNKMNGQRKLKKSAKGSCQIKKHKNSGKALRHTSEAPRVPWNTFPLAFQTTFSFLFVYLVIFVSKGINFANTIECKRNLTP